VATGLVGAGTTWSQRSASGSARRLDDNHVWDVIFAFEGPDHEVRDVRFAGRSPTSPADLRAYLLNKQASGFRADESASHDRLDDDRCVFCRHPFGSMHDDPFFGLVEIRRNRLNPYYCNQCDYFIRVCPGEATLMMPVLVVDVKGSRQIRRQVGDLKEYSRLLQRFRRRVAAEVQRNCGFVLNTIGDAVLAVWPSGFVPEPLREELSWDRRHPARIPALCAIKTARALVTHGQAVFDGEHLPFRGAVDTTSMVIFAVTSTEAWPTTDPVRVRDDEWGDPLPGVEASAIPTGSAAVDVAGEAVEVASELASDDGTAAGQMLITRRTDIETRDDSHFEYRPAGSAGVMARVLALLHT
jgi:hypothetical protein